MSGNIYLGLRTALGHFHRRLARSRQVSLIVGSGMTGGLTNEQHLVRGDLFEHPELGRVQVVGVERWSQ